MRDSHRYRETAPVSPSSTVGIFNDGTELRISTIQDKDIGDYTCMARNGEGQVSHTASVIIAGGATIMVIAILHSESFLFEMKLSQFHTFIRIFRCRPPIKQNWKVRRQHLHAKHVQCQAMLPCAGSARTSSSTKWHLLKRVLPFAKTAAWLSIQSVLTTPVNICARYQTVSEIHKALRPI